MDPTISLRRGIARALPGVTLFLAGLLFPRSGAAQTRPSVPLAPAATLEAGRPLPGPVYEIPEFTRAIERGTRTRSGRPGAANWVQHARYRIEARLDPSTHRVTGQEHVVYLNHSPDTLRQLAVHLRQNAFAAGNPRRQSAPITGGMRLDRLAVGGRVLAPPDTGVAAVPITDMSRREGAAGGDYVVDGTVAWIPLTAPVLPGDSVALDVAWSYTPPPAPSDGRQGREDNVYFMGYWYPQVAVYDDVNGWVADPYLLEAEFYMDPGDYDVRVTVPHGWVVGATGRLVNATEVLSPGARARLAEARRAGTVVHVLEPGPRAAAGFADMGPTATWHFLARSVRDFAWGASDEYVWDATRALVGDRGAARDTVDINSFYRPTAPAAAWMRGGARFTRDAIEQLSAYLWPYPWPTMTSMEGVLNSGGMEYPMLTLMQPFEDTLSLAGDLMHETGHMWFPMQVGSNEQRYPWMDEGFTQFDVAQAMRVLYGEPRAGGLGSGKVTALPRGRPWRPRPDADVARRPVPGQPLLHHVLRQDRAGAGRAAGDPRRGDLPPGLPGIRPPLERAAPVPGGFFQYHRRRRRARPGLVLAHVVLRGVAAGPGRGRGHHLGRFDRDHRRGPRPRADARSAGDHARGRAGTTARVARGRVADRGAPDHRPGGGAAGRGADRDRPGGRVSGR
jgi:hypothetical protein